MELVYIHFNEAELADRVRQIESDRWTIRGHASTVDTANIKDPIPDVLVLSLDRLPSHCHAYADWLWQAKKRQTIPIVFVGGMPDKVAATKAKYPSAKFCNLDELSSALEELL